MTTQNQSRFTLSHLNKKTVTAFNALEKEFANIAEKAKEDLITKNIKIDNSANPLVKQIKISEILSPPGFTRYNQSNLFEDLDILDNPEPIKVVRTKGVKGFFLIDGQRRLELQKLRGEEQINVFIIGEVVCLSQVAMARAKEMTMFKKPLKTLELVQGLLSLYETILNDFGEKAFFSHGGNRKTGTEDKQSLCQYITRVLGLKKSTVNALLNFGNHVGPYGLAGLYFYEDMQKLTIRSINQINAGLKKDNLRKTINEIQFSLHKANTTKPELIKACGKLAHNIILANITTMDELKKLKNSKKDIENEESEQHDFNLSDHDLPPKLDKKSKGSKGGDGNGEEDDGEDPDSEDEIKESIKILKRFKNLLPRFDKALRGINPSKKTIQNNLDEELKVFNVNVKNMISFIAKTITEIESGS